MLATNNASPAANYIFARSTKRPVTPAVTVPVPTPTRQPSEDQLLALQAFAIETNSAALLHTTYIALGRDSRYAFAPVTEGERRIALQSCADQIEMLAAMGMVLS